MAWIGPTEAAKRLGISHQALRKKLPVLADEGVARREAGRWLLRAEGLEVAYDDVTRSRADSPRRRAAPTVEQQEIVTVPKDERAALTAQIKAAGDDPEMPRSEAERLQAIAKAKLLEMDVQERARQLVEAEKVKQRWFEVCRRVRDLVMGVPVRVSADLAAETDAARVAIVLEKALVECLEGMDGVL